MNRKRAGFTLIEIMMVVGVIAMLTILAIPAFQRARQTVLLKKFAKEMLNISSAFEVYWTEYHQWPSDGTPGDMPEEVYPFLSGVEWSAETCIGGRWDWDAGVFDIVAGLSVYAPSCDEAQMMQIDRILDDGNLQTGAFRQRSGGYIYILEE